MEGSLTGVWLELLICYSSSLAGREEWLEGPLTGVWLGLLICCSGSLAGREE